MGDFLIGVLFFLIVIFIIGKIKTSNNNSKSPSLNFKEPQQNQKTPTSTKDIYIKKEVFQFELKGIFYNKHKIEGEFKGVAKTTYNSHDKYCVGIYINNQLAGYTPKGNFRLFNYLELNNNNLICWGYIGHDDFRDQYHGTVYIPINFTQKELADIEKAQYLIENQKTLFIKENKTTSEYFTILENDLQIELLLKIKKTRTSINYQFHKSIIPELSKKLEESKDWDNLLQLEKYNNQLNQLSEKFKNSTMKRIEKAKIILNTN